MTVLGLKISPDARMPFPRCMEKYRAPCGQGLAEGNQEEAVPIGHITNGVHVPTWLAPQMYRLFDRHLGTNWHQHSGEARIWEGIENVDDGELWETHLSLKSRLLEFVRRRAVEQAERRGEPAETLQRLSRVLSARRVDDRIRAAICDVQASEPDSGGHREARFDGERPEAAGAVRIRG